MNIVDLIFERNHGPESAIVSPEGGLSFAGLHARMLECEHAFRCDPNWPRDVEKPRIGLRAPSGADYIMLALAILKAGACFVPIPQELTESEQQELIERTALHAVLTAKNADEWSVEAKSPPAMPLDLNAAFIRFSSGTTAKSKGVVISHETLLARITAANEGLKIGKEDRVLWVLPMAHHFAVSIILYLYHGATTILAPASDPAVMLRLAREHGATVMYGSPYHYTMLAGQPDAGALNGLRLAVSTAFALSAEVADLFHLKTGLHLTQGMGIIEAGFPILNLEHAATKPTSIGRPQPSFEVKLDDGELLLRGPGLFDAYLSPWQPREAVLRDGWFPTGDMAEMDGEGCLFLKGRVRSVINVGGMKCFPEEVEAVLKSHPAVRAARVSGRAHPALGWVPVAEVIAENGAEPSLAGDLKKLCQQRLSAYKVPLSFNFVTELPLTASGKLRRY
ncbi:MAG: AMP-binding protein [Verrucomicrobiaceae bacterium]|nr:AMP-binding protein [Verrucomicrobiaceae bacterium]